MLFEFKGGEQYLLTYRAEDIPLTRVVVRNDGNSAADVTFDGPKRRELVINPGAQETISVQAGRYTIQCAELLEGRILSEEA
jgi:hypothetical protein